MLSSQQKTEAFLWPKFCKGVPSLGRASPIFYDAVIGGSTYGRPIDKQLSLTKTWSITVEAFGRHLKSVDASALYFVCM